MGAGSFPIIFFAESWGVDATLAVTATVVDEGTGESDVEEMVVYTRPAFPGEDTEPVPAAAGDPPRASVPGNRGPDGSVRFLQPQPGQVVQARRFRVDAVAENWGVDTQLHVLVEVANVDTGEFSIADCYCHTHGPFPGEDSEPSY